MPVILGIDTATPDTAVAVSDRRGGDHERLIGPSEGRPAHGRALLGAVEESVAEAGGWDAIELIAVGIGPGSFTGLRIGIATARALAQARRIGIVAVPSTAALLAGIAERTEAIGRARIAVVDARRGEVFVALDGGRGASDPLVCPPGELAAALGAEAVVGAITAGDGSLRFRSEIESAGAVVLAETDPAHRLSARHVCELGAKMAPLEPERIRPLYLRRPDAERWRERDGRN